MGGYLASVSYLQQNVFLSNTWKLIYNKANISNLVFCHFAYLHLMCELINLFCMKCNPKKYISRENVQEWNLFVIKNSYKNRCRNKRYLIRTPHGIGWENWGIQNKTLPFNKVPLEKKSLTKVHYFKVSSWITMTWIPIILL